MDVTYKYIGDQNEARSLKTIADHYLSKYQLVDAGGDHFNKTITLCSRKSINISRLGEVYTVTITVQPREPEIEMIEEGGRLLVNASPSLWVGVRILEPEAAKSAVKVELQAYVPNAIQLFERYGANAGDAYPCSATWLLKGLGNNYEHGYTKNTKFDIEGMTNYGYYFTYDEIDPFDGELWDVTLTASEDKYREHMQLLGKTFDPKDFYFIIGRYLFKVAAYDSSPCKQDRAYSDSPLKLEMRIVVGLPGHYRQSQRHVFTIEKPTPFKHQMALGRVLGEDVRRDAQDWGCWMYYWDDVGENPHTTNWWNGAAFAHITSQHRADPAAAPVDFWSPKGSITFTDETFIPDWGFNPEANVKSLEQFCDCDYHDSDKIYIAASGDFVAQWWMTYDLPETTPCDCGVSQPSGELKIRYGVDIQNIACSALYLGAGRQYVIGKSSDGSKYSAVPPEVQSKIDELCGNPGADTRVWQGDNWEHYCYESPASCVGGVPQFCGCDVFPEICAPDEAKKHIAHLIIDDSCYCPNGPSTTLGAQWGGYCGGIAAVHYLTVQYKNLDIRILTKNTALLQAIASQSAGNGGYFDIDRSPIGIPSIEGAQPVYSTNYYRAEDLKFYSYTEADGFQSMDNPVV